MMTLSELWHHFRLLQSPEGLSEKERAFLERFLQEEAKCREKRRLEYLMKMSGIQRVKLLADFDWTFNPKIPRDKIMEYLQTEFLQRPSSAVLIGAAGVGKSHIATALCHEAILKGHQTIFVSLFDFTARLAKAKNVFSFIDFYAKVPLLCLDELGYVFPTKDQADCIFQIISKRSEVRTTIITTNLLCGAPHKRFNAEFIVMRTSILDV